MVGGYWGLGQVLHNQPFPDNSRFYIPIQMRDQNLDKARQLLAEAGYPNGFKCELFEFNFTSYLSRAPVTLDQLRKIGIEGTIKIVDRAPYFRALRTGDYGVSVGGISERMDWDDPYYMYFHSSEIGKTNLMRYNKG